MVEESSSAHLLTIFKYFNTLALKSACVFRMLHDIGSRRVGWQRPSPSSLIFAFNCVIIHYLNTFFVLKQLSIKEM